MGTRRRNIEEEMGEEQKEEEYQGEMEEEQRMR